MTREGGKPSSTHCKKNGHDEEHCWKLHPEKKPKQFGGEEDKDRCYGRNILVVIQEMKEISQRLEYKVNICIMLVLVPMMNLILMNERRMSYFIYELYLNILR